MDTRLPPAEIRVGADLARALLAEQHADLAGGEIALVDEGWDNFTFRLGTELALRIPRREVAVQLIRNEQRWLPAIARWIDVAVPEPVRVGEPSSLFPWPWSVVRWLPGRTVEGRHLPVDAARLLATTLRSLHRPAPADAPPNPFRGVALTERRAVVEERFARVGGRETESLWHRALEAPEAERAVWLHGDPHPRNVLEMDDGGLGLIDWGDLTGGDPATDLACAWMLFDGDARAAFFEAYAPSGAEVARAVGWAVNYATGLRDSGAPRYVAIGDRVEAQLHAWVRAGRGGGRGR